MFCLLFLLFLGIMIDNFYIAFFKFVINLTKIFIFGLHKAVFLYIFVIFWICKLILFQYLLTCYVTRNVLLTLFWLPNHLLIYYRLKIGNFLTCGFSWKTCLFLIFVLNCSFALISLLIIKAIIEIDHLLLRKLFLFNKTII